MSKTDEIRNRFHSSIDAPSSVRQRNGESEDGEALGELLSDNSRSALEELEEREERPERVRFLKQFFALLKQTLTPEEFKFIKLRYTKKKTDRQIAVWLGFKSTGAVFKSIREKLRREERTLNRLVERSAWEGAKAFVKAITESVKELSQDTTLLRSEALKESGFAAFMKAQEIASERQQMSEKYRTHRRFFMRGVYYGTKISVPAEELYHKIRLRLYGLLGYIDAMAAVSDYQQKTSLEFYQGIRQDIREYVEMVKTLALPGKEGFFQELAGALLREDLDETKSYSDRCAEKREREAAYFAEPHKLPRIKKVDKLAEERLVEKGKAPEEKSRVLLLEHSEGRRGVAAQG